METRRITSHMVTLKLKIHYLSHYTIDIQPNQIMIRFNWITYVDYANRDKKLEGTRQVDIYHDSGETILEASNILLYNGTNVVTAGDPKAKFLDKDISELTQELGDLIVSIKNLRKSSKELKKKKKRAQIAIDPGVYKSKMRTFDYELKKQKKQLRDTIRALTFGT